MDLPKDTTWTRLKIICGSRRSLKIQVYLNSIFPVVFHFLFGFGWFYILFCTPIIIFCLMRRKKSFKSFSISGTIVTLVNYLNSGSNWYLVWRDLKSKSRKPVDQVDFSFSSFSLRLTFSLVVKLYDVRNPWIGPPGTPTIQDLRFLIFHKARLPKQRVVSYSFSLFHLCYTI